MKMRLKILLLVLRLLLAAVFIFSAISKLFPIEVFELNFVYQGISGWEMAPYLSRSLIIFELFLGLSLLFTNLLKRFVLPATFVLLLLFTIYLLYSLIKDGNEGNCGCFGTILPMTPLESILKNLVLMLIVAFIYTKSEVTKWRYKWLLPCLFVISSSTIVLLYPIYDYSYTTKPLKGETADIASLSGFSNQQHGNLDQGKKLVAVFNMACSHCIEVALKLSAAKTRVPLPETYYILLGDSSEVKDFYTLTNSSAPYKLMRSADFIHQFKTGWPRVILLQEGIIKYDNNYRTFNGQDFEKIVNDFLK
jgi:uncharacterized membrane protein YphA (DoxX/SURF4 family)